MTNPPRFPERGRLAGIDFGTVRIGIAVCDPGRMLASPLATYARRNDILDQKFFQQLALDEELAGWIVGLPVHMSGDESEKSRLARQFGEWLGVATGLPVRFQDERFTTAEADRALASAGMRGEKADSRRDMLAAQAILARYLESPRTDHPQSI
jgi:putative Holliday junction resolvase